MEHGSKFRFETFKRRFQEFLRQSGSKPTAAMFLYGLTKKGYFYIRELPELTKDFLDLKPISDTVKAQIDIPLLVRVENAEDDTGNSQLDNIRPGREELDYLLRRTLEFSRPDYCVFFILGMIKGSHNGGIIDKVEFIDLLQSLPMKFISKYGDEVVLLSNYFDESDSRIELSDKIKSYRK